MNQCVRRTRKECRRRGVSAIDGVLPIARGLFKEYLRTTRSTLVCSPNVSMAGATKRSSAAYSGVVAQHKQPSILKATEFECRHQKLVHQSILAIAFLIYLVDREDVVWRLVKNTAMPHALERFVFISATIFIAVGVGLCTWGSAHRAARGTRNGEPPSLLRHP